MLSVSARRRRRRGETSTADHVLRRLKPRQPYRELHNHNVTRTHVATAQHDGHHPRLAHELPIAVAFERRLHQVRLDLSSCLHGFRSAITSTTASSPRRRRPRSADRAGRGQRRDVLARLAPTQPGKPCGGELVVQLGVDEVHLAQVELSRIAPRSRGCFTVSPSSRRAARRGPRSAGSGRCSACHAVTGAPAHDDDRIDALRTPRAGRARSVGSVVQLGPQRLQQLAEVARTRQRSGPCCRRKRWNSDAIASPEGRSPGPSGVVSRAAACSRRSTKACTSGSDWTAWLTWRS
jgi:hypothetical protein